jgi:Zn-dependent M28 family amino/carboxypeptidase
VNLVARRGTPDVWLVAHLDTKSQPIPSLARAAAFVLMAGAMLVVGMAGVFGLIDEFPRTFAMLALLGGAAAVALSLSTVGNESPGGADNASGLATLLLVAARLRPERALGVLLTSAEELGLAGARGWVAGREHGRAINVDTVDDQGRVRCMTHGARALPLARALRSVAGQVPPGFLVGPLIPGILTDGVALAAAGWSVVTLSRGTAATLARIHRPSDTVVRLTGEGVDHLATLLVNYLDGKA